MSRAATIVDRLLKEEDDWKDFAITTGDPSALLVKVLRDQLTERGFRRIQVQKGDTWPGYDWIFSAEWINAGDRAAWAASGVRVAGFVHPPEAPRLMRLFKAAARRAHFKVTDAVVTDVSPVGQDVDLGAEYEDFEDIPGDYLVEIGFDAEWLDGFWSQGSQALGYEGHTPKGPVSPPQARRPSTDEPGPVQQELERLRVNQNNSDEFNPKLKDAR